jgi:hypothetical protein
MTLGAASAHAATIFVKLNATQDAVDQTIWHVQVLAHTDNSAAGGDGGISGMGFDILSAGTGNAAPIPAATVGPNAAKVKHAFGVITSGFSTIEATHTDASTVKYPLDVDTDEDSIGGSFFDTSSFSNLHVGQTGQAGTDAQGFSLIDTQDWKLTGPAEALNVFITSPTYYDFASSNNFQTAYPSANIVTTGTVLGVPEPTSLAMLSVGALGLIRRRRTA